MESYLVCNGNLVAQDTEIDHKDVLVIDEPLEAHANNSLQDGSLGLETDIVHESRKRNRWEWNQSETKILMDMYRRNVTQVGPMKKFKSKKEMFKSIAQMISAKLNITRSAHQCENRYRTVVNQRKVGRTILQKTKSNVEKKICEDKRSQNDVKASVSADHDYNGQNSETNIKTLKRLHAMKTMNEWGVDDTKLLMDMYRKNISKVGLERTFRTKLKMFEHIANAISNTLNITRTAEQCLNRYKTIFRRKTCKLNKLNNTISTNNTIIDNNINSNASMNCDTHIDNNSCEPVLSTHVYNGNTWLRKAVKQPKLMHKLSSKVEPITSEDTTRDTVLARTLKEIAAQKEKTLLKIAGNQERAEERRHQETMALIKQIGQSIIQCIGNRPSDTSE